MSIVITIGPIALHGINRLLAVVRRTDHTDIWIGAKNMNQEFRTTGESSAISTLIKKFPP